jgi:hypothetical protein
MPSTYPAVPSANAFKRFLGDIKGVGVPPKADQTWLKSIGYRANDHRSFLVALKFVKVLDTNGTPTKLWAAFRAPTPQTKGQLASEIKTAYAPLFATFDDAYRRDAEALMHWFRANTNGNDRQVSQMAGAFRTLADHADFPAASTTTNTTDDTKEEKLSEVMPPEALTRVVSGSGVELSVTIQLQLPATADADVYDKLFAAVRKHLINLGE